jgi:hypothetical protein
MTHYKNRGGEIWELCKDGQWRELFTDDAIRRLTHLESLAESNGKLAHDLGIKLTTSRQTRVCLFCGMESVTYVR